MKNKIIGLWLLFSLLVPVFAKDGQEGHGGDIIVAEFLIMATDISEDFHDIENTLLPLDSFADDFDDALRTTKVSSAQSVYLGDIEVDAINFPIPGKAKIIIGRNRWLDDRIKLFQRRRLIIHEYLSILGYKDIHYQLSHSLTKTIDKLEVKND